MKETNNNGIAFDNSFTLQLTNTTNYLQEVQLFQLGNDSSNSFRNVLAFSRASYQFQDQSPAQQDGAFQSYELCFFYVNDELDENLLSAPTIDDFFLRDSGNLELISDNDNQGTLSKVDIPLTSGMSMQQVNTAINLNLIALSDTTNFKNSNGDVMQFEFLVDINYLNTISYPISQTQEVFFDSYGFTIQYPQPNDLEIGSTGNPIRLSKILTASAPAPTDFAWIDIEGGELINLSSINGVEVITANNISYQELIESQNGGVYDIKSLDLNIGNSLNEETAKGQLLQPFLFDQKNANGDDRTYVKSPTIDPYQFQDSYKKLSVNGDSGNKFVLDSTSELRYSIEPRTTINVTFNYVLLRNFMFGVAKTMKQVEREAKKLNELDRESEKNIIELNINNEDINNTKKIFIKPKKSISLLKYSIGAMLLLYFLTKKPKSK
tara:strand:- start:9042 stop:10352 length:1311 start_codon:yes stop_codon:yes gene_type:complete